MDIVITYVDGLDPAWRQDYASAMGSEALETKRFRDWGTLKYLLRGIEKNMPFIRKVFLVVSRESQVPFWVDREKVGIVLHRDIIPSEYLPTFNCNTIELFIHRIPDLGEEFLYFNDDIFPVRFTAETDFFREGKPVVWHRRCLFAPNLYKKMALGTDRLARKAAGAAPGPFFVRPQHTLHAARKSWCEDMFREMEEDLLSSLSRVREEKNILYYIYSDCLYYRGLVERRKISNKHFSLAAASISSIERFLLQPTSDFVCINDVSMSDDRFESTRRALLNAFDCLLPQKSKYEL